MSVTLPGLLSTVFIAIGVTIIVYAIKMAAKAQQSLSWPSTNGEVVHSAVLFQSNTTTRDEQATYKADIVYRYKVRGANYSSSRIALLDLAATAGRAESIVTRYPDKSSVRVYYNPADPAEAVLEPGTSSGLGFLYAVGAAFACCGVFFLTMSLTGHVHMT